MKKILFLVLICCTFVYFCARFVFTKQKPSTINYQLTTNNSPSFYSSPTVSWNDITYAYEYFEVNDISKLTLIANFTQKKTSELLIKENTCQFAINGGYYDTNYKPLGLFMSPVLKTSAIESSLINGYVTITNMPSISFEQPNNPTLALQTGPMLMADGNRLKLAIKNDEHTRRMIAAISSKGTLMFITIFVPETKVQGPQLGDLPDILKLTTLDIVSAINLDGGNASMFKNRDIYIQEISSVGSLFCLKD